MAFRALSRPPETVVAFKSWRNPDALKMRPTGLSSGFYKDTVDYSIFCGEWCIGRIYETRTGPERTRWFWALQVPSKPGSMPISNLVV